MNSTFRRRSTAPLMLLSACAACVLSLLTVRAQTEPRIFFTWSAATYAPSAYTGKTLPVANAHIAASFELVDQGRVVNLSQRTISWHLDSRTVAEGVGLQSAEFVMPPNARGNQEVRIRISGGNIPSLLYSVSVPTTQPEAILEWRSPSPQFIGSSFSVRGIPYFFNVPEADDLSYEWEINSKRMAIGESPELLSVRAAETSPIRIELILNALSGEGARAALTLTPR